MKMASPSLSKLVAKNEYLVDTWLCMTITHRKSVSQRLFFGLHIAVLYWFLDLYTFSVALTDHLKNL